jgi:PEP-CTERM motif
MKTALYAATIGMAMLTGLSAPPAQAGYIVDLTQQGGDVVATGSGTIDLTGLSLFASPFTTHTGIIPSEAVIVTGPASGGVEDLYTGFTGPTSFGSGGTTSPPNSGSGNIVGIAGPAEYGVSLLGVPFGYVSGSPLSDTATYDGQTFTSLGATPGIFKWTWGDGANQNFTLDISIPEPATWAMMALGFAVLGFLGYRKTRSALA